MKNHALWMVIGCGVPLLLIFILPALGVGSGFTLFLVVILMFGGHLIMMGGHHGKHEKHEKEEEHGSH